MAKAKPQPAERVERWSIDRIVPYDGNPRTHPEAQIELLSRLMQAHGIDQPIVVDEDGVILKGHGRRLAAMKAGFKRFPVVVHRGLTEEEKRGIRVADNQMGLLSGWDYDLLRVEMRELKLSGFDLPLLGFDDATLNWLTVGDLVTDPDGEWVGMPHFNNPDATGFRSIVVHFHDQDGVDKFAKLMKQKITDKTRFMWFPEMVIKPFIKYEGAEGRKAAAK